jgi:tetratricopeptide (TPR) repeat protein
VTRALITICLLALAGADVAADPAAEQLFRDGRALLKAGKVDEACDKFQQSRDVEAKFGTVLNLADCRERQGKFATAWELFLEAKALAETQKGARDVAEAAQRAKKIAGKRAFLTVAIPAEDHVPGLVILRNGTEVAASTWDQPLAIDPGTYAIEAKANGYESAKITVTVAAKANVTAPVPALVKLAVVEPPPEPPVLTPSETIGGRLPPVDVVRNDRVEPPPAATGVSPRLRHAAFGLTFGFTHKGDATYGARAIIQTTAGPGAIRGVISAFYTAEARIELDTMDDATRKLVWFGAEYLLAWRSGFASAAGVGYGIEHIAGGYDLQEGTKSVTRNYPSLRFSPIILRLSSAPLELGIHAVLDFRKDLQTAGSAKVLVTTLALDWFFW